MMHKPVNRIAVQSAVPLFFVISVLGWFCGLEPAVCAERAALAALAAFVVIKLAGKMVMKVLVGALVEDQVRRKQSGQSKG